MLKQDFVTRISRRLGVGSNRAASLAKSAGKARAPMADAFEALEPRILLSGDHPGIDEVFDDVMPVAPTIITLDGNGQGNDTGQIGDVMGDTGDFFQFTAATDGFVSILADSNGGALDTALELYLPDGTKLSGDTEGLDNGTTARGLAADGWLGFVADAGQDYYVRVLGESGTTGNYDIEINARNNQLVLNTTTGIVRTGSTGAGDQQIIDDIQEDILYTFTTPDLAKFDSLGSIMAGDIAFGDDGNGYVDDEATVRMLIDTRVELYDAAGNLLGADSSSGHQSDGFLLSRFERDTTYYVRVRSDAFETVNVTNPQDMSTDDVAVGQFELRIQAAATTFDLDPVTRLGVKFRNPADPMSIGVELLRDQHSAQLFVFNSLGTGDTIINFTTFDGFLQPGWDPKIALFDDTSTVSIDNNDSAFSFDTFDRAEIQTNLIGGQTYYVLVDAFDGPFLDVTDPAVDIAAGQQFYQFVIESNATIDLSDPDQPIDDHIDFLANTDIVRDLATPLIWGDAFNPVGFVDAGDYILDPGGNPIFYGFDTPFGPMPRYPSVFDFPNVVTDHSEVVQASAWGRLDTNADTDVFMFVPQVDHLGRFEGSLLLDMDDEEVEPNEWNVDGRPSSRISISVNFELEWLQTGTVAIQVYDSNFNLVNEDLATPLQSVNTDTSGPAGLESPSLLAPDPTSHRKQEVAVTLDNEFWGGEAYYIVVSAPGSRTRYNLVVQSDAIEDTYATNSEAPEEGNFGDPEQLIFDIGSGVATTFGNPSFSTDVRDFAFIDSGLDPVDDFGTYFDQIVQRGELGNISTINDTDVYRFVAPKSGTSEIVISTTQITDRHTELYIDNANGIGAVNAITNTKTYNSPLDAAIRIFDSSGNQIAYVNDFLGYLADGLTIPFGNSFNNNVGDLQFFRKDPRAVIDVVEGEEYFVLIESSQRWKSNAADANSANRVATDPAVGDVDWRVATGSYQLVVNTTPNLSAGDDHADFPAFFQETVIAFDSDPNSPTNGTGSISGIIEAESDFDSFAFMAPKDGLLTLTIDPAATLSLAITIFDGDGNQIFLPNNTAIGGEPLTTSFVVSQSERYSFSVFGLAGAGSYTMDLSGLPVSDDLPDQGRFFAAQELEFGDFSRSVTSEGTLDQGGDSDIFFFDADVSDLATLTVSRQDGQAAMTPAVIVYELGQDNAATPLPLNHVIAWDLNPDNTGSISIDFSTQAGRRYFVVVRGSNPSDSLGGFDIEIDYNPDDDHADIGELLEATFINIVPSTGAGTSTGILEQSNDSDLFVFGVPANGPVDISLVWDSEPGATFELQIFDIDGNVFDVDGDMMIDTYSSNSGFLAIDQFEAFAADIFYVAVVGPTASRISYTLNVNTGLVDDHANDAAFDLATVIPLDLETGDGSSTGRLEVDDDTDFFTFDILDTGIFSVDVDAGTIGTLVFKLYDSSMNLLTPTMVDADSIEFDNFTGPGETFYVSIGSTFPGVRTGSYTVNVDGPPIAPSPDDDHVNIGNLLGATFLNVNTTNGNASDTGIIDVVIDNDLFRYDTIGRGEIYVQVVSGDTPTPDFTVRIFDGSGNEITSLADSAGIGGVVGVTAATNFVSGAAGQTFYILVDSTGDMDTGSYTLRVDGPAVTTRTYYPEGFANAGIHEFISLANPNDESVTYNITVYYADLALGSAVVSSGTLAAGARGGATLSFGGDIDNDGNADYASGIIANEAYAIVVESTLRLGASLSHYDSNLARSGSIGEAFTENTANRWDFPDVSRNPGVTEDFLVYYNPNSFDVNITITAYTGNGSSVSLPVMTLGANKRGGLEIHNTATLPLGTFAVEITSSPVDSANNDIDLGIVAGLSRYNLVDRFAFGHLGIRDGGNTTNIITSLTNGTDVTGEFSIFNAGATDATVDIVGSYLEDTNLPDLIRQVTVGAGERMRLTGTDLAFVTNETLGLTITSDVDIAVSSIERQRGDANATTAFTEAGTSFYFGDAFMNPARAGDLYTETLSFYNPNDSDTDVSITFYFADGSAERVRMETIATNDFLLLKLENIAEVIQSRPLLNYYSMRIDASAAVVVEMKHYDGFLGGGWGTGGANLGILGTLA
jgi:hypothetical protein